MTRRPTAVGTFIQGQVSLVDPEDQFLVEASMQRPGFNWFPTEDEHKHIIPAFKPCFLSWAVQLVDIMSCTCNLLETP
jgi:hypothetical protein